MRWEQLFADLEARFVAAEFTADEAQVVDLVRAERARLVVSDRLRAHLGESLTWSLAGGSVLAGCLKDVGADWVLLETPGADLLTPLAAVDWVGGLTRFTAAEAGPVARRLGIGVILRGLCRDRAVVSLRLRGDQWIGGTIDRVGTDHLDVAVHPDDEPRRERAVRAVRCVMLPAVLGVAVR